MAATFFVLENDMKVEFDNLSTRHLNGLIDGTKMAQYYRIVCSVRIDNVSQMISEIQTIIESSP